MEKHLAHLRLSGYSPTTIYARRRAITRLAAALPVPLCDADPAMLREWRASLTITDEAVAAYVSHARNFYDWTTAEGFTSSNPAAGLPVPRLPRRVPRPVAEDDLMRALAAAAPRLRPWLVLAGWAGLRACEVAGLRRENILDSVRPPVLVVAAEATKGRTERVVPLSAFACGELAAARLPAAGYAFTRRDGQRGPNAPWLVSRLAGEHFRDLGIAATLHMCRHRFGTQLYQATHDLRLVQELMGHASPRTTAGYAAYSRTAAAAAVDELPCPGLRAVR